MIEVLLVALFAAIAVGRLPVLRMNRATVALFGAVALILAGALTLDQALAAIDLKTIVLLLAMMIFTANLKAAGFFRLAGNWLLGRAHSPPVLLALVILLSGVLSALFVNDTIALMLTPLLLELTLTAGLNPLPYLLALAVSANIGSMATLIGNPQNILIGTASGLPFADFTAALAVPALVSLALAYAVIFFLFRADFTRPLRLSVPHKPVRVYKPLLYKSLLGLAVLGTGIALGLGIVLSGLAGAALLLVTRRVKPERIFSDIDWSLLVFFAGLFILTKAVQTRPMFDALLAWATPLMQTSLPAFAAVSAALSNLISNVPAVMLLQPFIPAFPDPHQAWIALAASSTLAGNLTLLGSVCNLIVAESAKTRSIPLSFGTYLKAGVPITLLTLVFTLWWLMIF